MSRLFFALLTLLSLLSGGKDQVFTWDAQGRLVNVEEYADGSLASTWTAAYDGLGRRLQTTTTPYGGATTTINSSFDPQAEFLEIGVNVNGVQNWKVHGPDLKGSFGGLNGTGGLEAVISPAGTMGTITDSFGNVVASVSGNGTVSWNFTKVGSYGPLPNSSSRTLESGATLIEASTWRNRRLDPTGYVNLGARHYDPTTGRFICPDPLGHGASWSLYDFADGDGVNNFDADGRVASQVAKAGEELYSALNPAYGEARGIDRVREALGVEAYTPANAAIGIRQADSRYAANWEKAYLAGGDTQATTAQYAASRNNAVRGYGEALLHVDALNQPAYDSLILAGMVMSARVGISRSSPAEKSTILYRGVPAGTKRFEQSLEGIVEPRGTAIDSMSLRAHVLGGEVKAGVTSWTTDKAVASSFAGSEGKVLQLRLDKVSDRIVPRPFVDGRYGHESEILLQGKFNINNL